MLYVALVWEKVAHLEGPIQDSNFIVLLTTSKLWQDFVYHGSSYPRALFSSSPRVAAERDATIDRGDGPGRTDDRLTDWLTGWRTVMRCLRLHYDWVSNLIAYTNFIYVTWVHFVPPSVHRGMKVSSFPEEDRKWSVSICNAFSRFSIGNVWISDVMRGRGKSKKLWTYSS